MSRSHGHLSCRLIAKRHEGGSLIQACQGEEKERRRRGSGERRRRRKVNKRNRVALKYFGLVSVFIYTLLKLKPAAVRGWCGDGPEETRGPRSSSEPPLHERNDAAAGGESSSQYMLWPVSSR